MSYIFYSLIAALGYGSTHLFNKKLMLIVKDPFRGVWYSNTFLVLTCLVSVIITGNVGFPEQKSWPYLLLASLIGMFALVSLFEGFKRSKIALIITVANTYPLITFILTSLFMDIKINPSAFIGIFVIIFGLALLSIDNLKNFKIDGNLIFGFFTSLGWGLFSFTIRFVQDQGTNSFMTIFLLEFFILVFLCVFMIFTKRRVNIPRGEAVFPSVVGGISMGLGAVFFSIAAGMGHPAIVASIESSNPALAAILAFFFLHERLNKRQISAIFITIMGVIILTLTSR